MLKIKLLSAIVTGALISPVLLSASAPASAQVRFGNVGSEGVNSIVGSGSKRRGAGQSISSFEPNIQSKINSTSAGLTVASLSGTQTVSGQTVNVDSATMQTAFDLINSPMGADTPARAAFAQSLGNSSSAQNLALSMQGMRKGDGTIDATVLTNSVNAYNAYIQTLASDPKAPTRSGEIDTYVQSLPPGQKVAQVLLGKLLEAGR
jgi:hypothetical protein